MAHSLGVLSIGILQSPLTHRRALRPFFSPRTLHLEGGEESCRQNDRCCIYVRWMAIDSHWHMWLRHSVDSGSADCFHRIALRENNWRSYSPFACNVISYGGNYHYRYSSGLCCSSHWSEAIQLFEIRYNWVCHRHRSRTFLFAIWRYCRPLFRCAHRRVRVRKKSRAGIGWRDWGACWIPFRCHHQVGVLRLHRLLFL